MAYPEQHVSGTSNVAAERSVARVTKGALSRGGVPRQGPSYTRIDLQTLNPEPWGLQCRAYRFRWTIWVGYTMKPLKHPATGSLHSPEFEKASVETETLHLSGLCLGINVLDSTNL